MPRWYVGAEGGAHMGMGTFKWYGEHGPHIGAVGGLFGGYRFSPLLSAELSVSSGKMTMSAKDCCNLSDYWLGQDGERYRAPVVGFEGWHYKDLKSVCSLVDYSVQLNVNLITLFNKTSRCRFELSPLVGMAVTQTDIRTYSDNVLHIKGAYRSHFAWGGQTQFMAPITSHIDVGIYSGITLYQGRRIDNIPVHCHKSNYSWDAGLRVSYAFHRKPKPKQVPVEIEPIAIPKVEAVITIPTLMPEPHIKEVPDTLEVLQSIFFDFDKHDIRSSEVWKMEDLLQKMVADPEMTILLDGYCDLRGSEGYNDRLAVRRVESVKRWLVEHGISEERISTAGHGIDRGEMNYQRARRTTVYDKKRNILSEY